MSEPGSPAEGEKDEPHGAGVPPDEVTPFRTPRPRTWRDRVAGFLFLVGFSILAFGVGLFVFNGLVAPRLIHGNAEIRVPDLANLTLEQAERTLGTTGLQLSRAGERFDPSVPRGFILSQDPPPDVPVRGRRRVMVVVSLGEEFSSVPALFGESMRGAQLLIDRAGLHSGGVTRAPFEDVGEGLVVGSDPPAEAVMPRESPVALLVSTGPGVEYYVMPDVVGREISRARHQLETFGFRVLTPPAAPNVGPIVFQQPAAGSRITRDVTVVLQATGRVLR